MRKSERENEFPFSCLIEIQRLFSSQPPTHLRRTTRERCGRQEEKESGDLVSSTNGTGPQNAIARSPTSLPANVHLATSSTNATDTPSSFTLDCYHGNSLFSQCSLSEEDRLSQSSNNPFYRTNTCRPTLFQQCYCGGVFVAALERKQQLFFFF